MTALPPSAIRTIRGLRLHAGFTVKSLAALYRVPEAEIKTIVLLDPPTARPARARQVQKRAPIKRALRAKERVPGPGRHGPPSYTLLPAPEIGELYATRRWSYEALAKKYGVSTTAVYKVIDRYYPHLKKSARA